MHSSALETSTTIDFDSCFFKGYSSRVSETQWFSCSFCWMYPQYLLSYSFSFWVIFSILCSFILGFFSNFYYCLLLCSSYLGSLILLSSNIILLLRPPNEFFIWPAKFFSSLMSIWHFLIFMLIYSWLLMAIYYIATLGSLKILKPSSLNSLSERIYKWLILFGSSEITSHNAGGCVLLTSDLISEYWGENDLVWKWLFWVKEEPATSLSALTLECVVLWSPTGVVIKMLPLSCGFFSLSPLTWNENGFSDSKRISLQVGFSASIWGTVCGWVEISFCEWKTFFLS